MTIHTDAAPLRLDSHGVLRVGRSHVLVELVVHAYQNGATPEEIARSYPTAELANIYGVVAYYLRHTQEIDAYLAERERIAQEVRARIEKLQNQDPKFIELRNRIRAQRKS